MVHTDVALRMSPKLVSLDDNRVIELCMDGSWLPYLRLTKDGKYVDIVYINEIETFNEVWDAIIEAGHNSTDRRAKVGGLETRRMKAQREKAEAGLRTHKIAVKKSQQYSGFLFKAMFNRMRASSGNRVPWLDFVEDLLVGARDDFFNGRFDAGEWIRYYFGGYGEDFRFEQDE